MFTRSVSNSTGFQNLVLIVGKDNIQTKIVKHHVSIVVQVSIRIGRVKPHVSVVQQVDIEIQLVQNLVSNVIPINTNLTQVKQNASQRQNVQKVQRAVIVVDNMFTMEEVQPEIEYVQVVRVDDTHWRIIVTNVLLYLHVWRLEWNVQVVIMHLPQGQTANKLAFIYTIDIIPVPPIYCLLHLEITVNVVTKIQLVVVVAIFQIVLGIHTSRMPAIIRRLVKIYMQQQHLI